MRCTTRRQTDLQEAEEWLRGEDRISREEAQRVFRVIGTQPHGDVGYPGVSRCQNSGTQTYAGQQ